MSESPVLARLSGVHKVFRRDSRRVTALEDVHFELRAGRLVGLFGNNGAGKTTLSRILTGTLDPDQGMASVCGFDVLQQRAAAQRHTGLCAADERSFYPRLTGLENLQLFARLRGIDETRLARRLDTLRERLLLHEELLGRAFQTYSSGERQRLNLARGFLHEPEVLVVDEALRSADPGTVERVASLLRDYVREGPRVILYTGHEFHGIEDLCDEIAVLDHGRLVLHGTHDEVLRLARPSWRLEFDTLEQARAAAATIPGGHAGATGGAVRVAERGDRRPVVDVEVDRVQVARCLQDDEGGLVQATFRRHSQVRELLIEVAEGRARQQQPTRATSGDPEAASARRPAPSVLGALAALLQRDRRTYFSHRFQLFVQAGNMLLLAGLFFFVARLLEPGTEEVRELVHGDYLSYLVLGLAFLQLSQVCLLHVGNAVREEQLQGTFEVMLTSGRSPLLLLVGSLTWPLCVSATSVVLLMLAATAFFGVDLRGAAWGGVLTATTLTTFVFACLGVISAAFVVCFKRGDPVAKVLVLMTLLVGGTYFPVETLPAWLRPFGELHPMTHGLRAVRSAALDGVSFGATEFSQPTGVLLAMATVLGPVAVWAYARALGYARRRGGLGHA